MLIIDNKMQIFKINIILPTKINFLNNLIIINNKIIIIIQTLIIIISIIIKTTKIHNLMVGITTNSKIINNKISVVLVQN